MLRVQAADSAKRAEELQQQVSACQVIHPSLLSLSCILRRPPAARKYLGYLNVSNPQ